MRRFTSHMQSPTVKDVKFFKKESELGMLSPLSPTSPHFICAASPSDPLEFPRSKLYIFNKKVLGMFEVYTVDFQYGIKCYFSADHII